MKVLARGYTITTSENEICHSMDHLHAGDRITTRFYDGEVISVVESTAPFTGSENGENT